MTDAHAPFLRAVVENPLDDGPRLVYADWLDEQGDGELAEFIRVQIELATLGPLETVDSGGTVVQWAARRIRPRYELLKNRELELWELKRPYGWVIKCPPGMPPTAHVCIPQNHIVRAVRRVLPMAIFRRGFVDEIRCPLAHWLDNGRSLLLTNPLTYVLLTDRGSAVGEGSSFARWWLESDEGIGTRSPDRAWTLPAALFDRLPHGPADTIRQTFIDYPSVEAASAALSAACLAVAREQAGLPTLPAPNREVVAE